MQLLESFTHRLIPEFIHDYIFEKFKLDEYLINHVFYFPNVYSTNQFHFNEESEEYNFQNFLDDKYIFNQRMPAYLPYIIETFKIFHFCDNNIIKAYIKKSKYIYLIKIIIYFYAFY